MPLCISEIIRSICSSLCFNSDSHPPRLTYFPLLQLPLVAMEHVLSMMSPFELINVSLASSRSKRAVKSISRTKKKFSVSFSNYWSSVSFHRHQMIWSYAIHINKDDAYLYKVIHQNEEDREMVIKVSDEPLKDVMKWYDYAREVLNCKIDSVTLKFNHPSSENRRLIDWIAAQNKTMEYMDLSSADEESNDDVKYLLERIHVTGIFNLELKKYNDDFRMEIPGNPEWLYVSKSQFIDYEQLLRLKSPAILLWESILTNEEINRFLKSWMSCETHLQLEAIVINAVDPISMNEIMDLPHEKTNDPKIAKAFNGKHFHVQVKNEMFTMKRCDGKKKATVTIENKWKGWSLFLIVH
uniref:F-box domain-containing protein n=2 Tax=Caenorhabditis tropicalis TaxID=1561998 RepID=A0A1I7UU32_9PELO